MGGLPNELLRNQSKRENKLNDTDNVFQCIKTHGDDIGWEPEKKCKPCLHQQGSREKLDTMRDRVQAGQAIHHEEDGLGVSHS